MKDGVGVGYVYIVVNTVEERRVKSGYGDHDGVLRRCASACDGE